MQLFLNILVGSVIQILVVGIIPFIWWLVAARKKVNFLTWIGLKKFTRIKKVSTNAIIPTILFILLSLYILMISKDIETATSQFRGFGASGIAAVILYSFVQTSFTEEVFFRGFLLKRIAAKFGFYAGNIVQSILFALLHCVMFLSSTGVLNLVIITLFTGIIAFLFGIVNEKAAEGSILPSWCIHGISNLIPSLLALFSVL